MTTPLDWSPQQSRVLSESEDWLADPGGEQWRYLAGFAGSGKSTLAKYLADAGNRVTHFCAYTGKAAMVMRSKGCANASTIHSLIYKPTGTDTLVCRGCGADAPPGGTHRSPRDHRSCTVRERVRPDAAFTLRQGDDAVVAPEDLIVVDEVSMADEEIGRDLLSYGARVLVLGDPAQLPPVKGGGFFTSGEPHWMLTEVHRHALDSGILRFATDIREGRGLKMGTMDAYGADVLIGTESTIDMDEALAYVDQVLVGKNATRHVYNMAMRAVHQELGNLPGAKPGEELGDYPVEGDKLVCLRNDRQTGLLNGGLWRARADSTTGGQFMGEGLRLKLRDEDSVDRVVECEAHPHHFDGRSDQLQSVPWSRLKLRQEFTYGYALTCHKAQGSQWDKVLVKNESRTFKKDAKRWLYTAVTRAARELVVINP